MHESTPQYPEVPRTTPEFPGVPGGALESAGVRDSMPEYLVVP